MSDWIVDLLTAARHLAAGEIGPAESLLRDVLVQLPDQPSALFMLGCTALTDGRPAEAAALLARAVRVQPTHRDSRLAAARALLASDQPAAALDMLEPLATQHDLFAAQLLVGTALNALDRPAEAVVALRHAVAADPGHAEAQLNLGNALAACDDTEAAELHLRRAVALDPALPEAQASLGHLLAETHRLSESLAASERAIRLRPDFVAAHWNQSVAHLLNGDFAAGWAQYEWRKRRFPDAFAPPDGPEWDGAAPQDRTLLVLAEQGLGDTIQFSRYLPLLAGLGARVVLECAACLAPLLRQLQGVTVIPRGADRPRCDAWVDLMSLPRLFGTRVDTIPHAAGYLRSQPDLATDWDALLPSGLRVGFVAFGGPLHANDHRRSIPAATLAPVVEAAAGGGVSLQVGSRSGEMARLFGVPDLSERLTDFAKTSAAIGVLDLIITVDTAVAHLAGALGVPVWLMLPYAPDWRWMLHRHDSPWYSSMRLFRQPRPGDWLGVAARVAAALAGIVRPPYSNAPPHSIAMPPLTCKVAPVTQAASFDAR